MASQKTEESLQMEQLLVALITKINDSVRSEEISSERGVDLCLWVGEFVSTLKLPEEERAEAMRSVIQEGLSKFEDTDLFRNILSDSFGINVPKKCSSCGGSGTRKCWKCDGAGMLYGETPSGYIGMPIRSPCDSCYGRGYDICHLCSGKGYL